MSKKEKSKVIDCFVTKTVKKFDGSKLKTGMCFTASIEGMQTKGQIFVENKNNLYLCQNAKNGASTKNKLNYLYSWVIINNDLEEAAVKNLVITDIPKGWKIPEVAKPLQIAGYEAIVEKGLVKFGCKTVKNNEIRELVKRLKD